MNTPENKARIAKKNGWTEVHGGDTGAYWRGINPITKKMEAIPEDQMVKKLDTATCSAFLLDLKGVTYL